MRTALYEKHCQLGAKIIDFAGWQMPIYYKGVIYEHQLVRNKAGLFDVSHMGYIQVFGKDAEQLLEYLSTNRIANKQDDTAIYTVWCKEDGGSLDDLIIYRLNSTEFILIVNASNRQKDLNHLKKYGENFDLTIQDRFMEMGILAVQGPQALPLVQELFPQVESLPAKHFFQGLFLGEKTIVARTGYTGEDGFEISISNIKIEKLWDELLNLGVKYGMEPAGLGARDTLRLEMGYALYGHELSEAISPTESVSSWTVKLQKKDFLGKEALLKLEKSSHKKSEKGIVLIGEGIAREGNQVLHSGLIIGYVTSGTFSPSLKRSIAIILVEKSLQEGELVEVQIRDRLVKAQVVSLPFFSKEISKEI